MASGRELPPDVAAALDRVPEAGSRFAALPPDRQAAWLAWIDRTRSRRARAGRIDEMIRRLLPSAAVAEEEVTEPVGPPFDRYWWLWLVLLLLLVLGGLLAWYFLTRGNDKATVPNVIGLRGQQAAIRIQDRGLEVLPRTTSSKRPPGIVFAEKPGPGTQLDKGQAVTIFISSGAKPVVVPRVVGQTQGAAVQALTKVGLKPILQNVSSVKPAGTVVGQKPPAGKEIDKGSEVTVNVSTGAGSATTTTTTTTTTMTTGTTTSAAASVRVPRVVGLAQTPALRRLNLLGLYPTVVYVRSSQPANRVVAQSPVPGTTLQRSARVRVNVSTGPNPQPNTAVPSVLGQDQVTGVQGLRDAGFEVAVLNRPTADQSQDGLVVEQQPRADSNIPTGSQVTIFVGRFSG